MSWSRIKHAFSSKDNFIRALEAPGYREEIENGGDKWSNIDLVPSPPEDRKWTAWTYLAFWVSHAAGVGNWTAGSSLIALGLYPLDTWLALSFAHLFGTIWIVANGRGPARYHVGFPIMARSTFGMWGSYMVVSMRAVVCIIWNAVNSYYASRLVNIALICIWPRWRTLPNALPESAGITSTGLASFFIFMLVFQGVSFVHSRDLKYFYYYKSISVGLVMHGILIWWLVKGKNIGLNTLKVESGFSRVDHAWLVLQAFNTGLGTVSSLTVNQGDIARYARTPSAQLWTTLIGYPIASALPCLYGILVASATKKLTGKAIWNLWDTLDYMLEQYPENKGARFLIWYCAASLALAYMGVNLATNSLPFGSDVTALFPRWMTIRRGQVICTMLSVPMVPWKLVTTASAFVTFTAGYGYFLAPIAACLFGDYFWVKRGNLIVSDLFVGNSASRYWFTGGWNLRAIGVVLLSLLPCLPSFASTIPKNHLNMPLSARRLFYISFVMTFFIALAAYIATYYIWPERDAPEKGLRFEAMADEAAAEEAARLETRRPSADSESMGSEAKDEKDTVKTYVREV